MRETLGKKSCSWPPCLDHEVLPLRGVHRKHRNSPLPSQVPSSQHPSPKRFSGEILSGLSPHPAGSCLGLLWPPILSVKGRGGLATSILSILGFSYSAPEESGIGPPCLGAKPAQNSCSVFSSFSQPGTLCNETDIKPHPSAQSLPSLLPVPQ